jgi:hypothetical protein
LAKKKVTRRKTARTHLGAQGTITSGSSAISRHWKMTL